jgi:hypothetical protein
MVRKTVQRLSEEALLGLDPSDHPHQRIPGAMAIQLHPTARLSCGGRFARFPLMSA